MDKVVSRANGTEAIKVAVYSGHDSTILPLLCAFQGTSAPVLDLVVLIPFPQYLITSGLLMALCWL